MSNELAMSEKLAKAFMTVALHGPYQQPVNDAIDVLIEGIISLTAERDRAFRSLGYECPRFWHVNGIDAKPDDCERIGMTAGECNLADGLGWETCPEYPDGDPFNPGYEDCCEDCRLRRTEVDENGTSYDCDDNWQSECTGT